MIADVEEHANYIFTFQLGHSEHLHVEGEGRHRPAILACVDDSCAPINEQLTRKSRKCSTRIKDAGIAIRHSQGRILFYTAGSRNGLKGLGSKDARAKWVNLDSKSSKSRIQLLEVRKINGFPPEANASLLAGMF